MGVLADSVAEEVAESNAVPDPVTDAEEKTPELVETLVPEASSESDAASVGVDEGTAAGEKAADVIAWEAVVNPEAETEEGAIDEVSDAESVAIALEEESVAVDTSDELDDAKGSTA